MNEEWMTAEWATQEAERMEADARRMRDLAERLRNPGLLPDEPGYVRPNQSHGLAGCLHGWC